MSNRKGGLQTEKKKTLKTDCETCESVLTWESILGGF
jgi:hypothetical protein